MVKYHSALAALQVRRNSWPLSPKVPNKALQAVSKVSKEPSKAKASKANKVVNKKEHQLRVKQPNEHPTLPEPSRPLPSASPSPSPSRMLTLPPSRPPPNGSSVISTPSTPL